MFEKVIKALWVSGLVGVNLVFLVHIIDMILKIAH